MSEAQSNNQRDSNRRSTAQTLRDRDVRRIGRVQHREGSRFADKILKRLQSILLEQSDSAIVGVLGCGSSAEVTTTAVNLAIRAADHALAPVLIIDGNLRERRVTDLFACHDSGLGECLLGVGSLSEYVVPTKYAGLSALGAGNIATAGLQRADRKGAAHFFNDARQSFPITIVDLSVSGESDRAEDWYDHLDGILLVVKSGMNRHELVELRESVMQSGGQILGVVVTDHKPVLPNWLRRFF